MSRRRSVPFLRLLILSSLVLQGRGRQGGSHPPPSFVYFHRPTFPPDNRVNFHFPRGQRQLRCLFFFFRVLPHVVSLTLVSVLCIYVYL